MTEVKNMERRLGKIIIHASGGTAAKGANTYKLTLPSAWVKEMSINESEREVELSFDGNTITITHCGDSRCYLMRGDDLVYQTKDHVGDSFGWEIVTKCFFSYKPEAAVPDIAQFEMKPGDRILLCSDGLYKSMPPEILKARMMDDKTPEELLDVYDFLCEKNGDDNYTAILAIIE